jgi:hypothetical protein
MRTSSLNQKQRRSAVRLIVGGLLVVFFLCGVLAWRGLVGSEDGEASTTRAETRESSSGSKSTAALMQDPFGFLLSFVPGKKLRVCATDVATVPKGGESHRYRVTASRDACDVFVTSGGADLREHGLQRVKPNGFVVWSWSKKSELSHNSKIFGENPHETVYFLERHLLTPVYRYEFRGMVHLLLQKPAKPFVNPTLDAFMEDRKNSEYGETPRAKESYAFVITIPYNFDKEMADEHLTAVFQLRKRDPTRDVCVFLVLNTPPGGTRVG